MIKLTIYEGNNSQDITFFDDVKIAMKYDSVASTFACSLFLDPTNQRLVETLGVSHFHECFLYYVHPEKGLFLNGEGRKVSTTDELLLTGYILSLSFSQSSQKHLVQIGGYSKAGVLEDSNIPKEVLLESNNISLKQIIDRVIKPFRRSNKRGIEFTHPTLASITADKKSGINAELSIGDVQNLLKRLNRPFPKSTAEDSSTVKEYLAGLATRRNLVLTHDDLGNLHVTVPNFNERPILVIDADKNPGVGYLEMNLSFNGQGLHSEIQVIGQSDDEGGNAAEYTIKNPLCPVVYRPKKVSLTVGDDVTIQEAARNELGKELKGIVLTVRMNRAAIGGRLIRPNKTVLVKSRELYLFSLTKWFIESVDFEADSKHEAVLLTCVLPYVYNNETPVNPFLPSGKDLPAGF
jgi:prophage tail gpP-like protein